MLVRVKGNVIFQKTNTVNVTDLKKPGWNVVLNVTSSQNWDIRPDGYFGRIVRARPMRRADSVSTRKTRRADLMAPRTRSGACRLVE